jgi:hypothetical protein
MNIEYYVYDDLLTKVQQDYLADHIEGPNFYWTYCNNTYYGETPELKSLNDPFITEDTYFGYQFVNVLYTHKTINENGVYQAQNFHIVSSIIKAVFETKICSVNLLRCKVNMLLKRSEVTKEMHDVIHGDSPEKHYVAIYYVNDYDGDTMIFEGTDPQNFDKTKYVTVSPKKGRLVLFNGKHLHCAKFPVDNNRRIVINFNFLM